MTIVLRDYQQEAVNAIAHALREHPWALCVAGTGCHEKNARILMASGKVKLAHEVKIGDRLLGPDGKVRTVLRLHRGIDELYEVSSKKMNPFVVNGGHLLALYMTPKDSRRGAYYEYCRADEYEGQSITYKHRAYLFRPGIPVSWDDQLPIKPGCSPYLLGAYLADGSFGANQVLSLSKNFLSWESLLKEDSADLEGYYVRRCVNNDSDLKVDLFVTRGVIGKGRGPNEWTQRVLRCADGDIKRVPLWVKYGSVETRAQYLAGVLDGDGHCDKGNSFELTLKHIDQIEDLRFIALSLGICVSKIAKKPVRLKTWDEPRDYYRIHLCGDFSLLPLLEKKITATRQKKNPSLFKPQIRHIGRGDYYGWEVDGDNLYLDAEFICHHNSGKGVIQAEIARRVLEKNPSWRVLVLCHTQEILSQNNAMCERMGLDSGIYCAGLGRKDKTQRVIHASRDSLGRNPHAAGAFNLVIIDEVHLCSDDEDTRYRKVLDAINPRYTVGLTGTPFRTAGGYIYGKRKMFPGVAYSIPAKTLVDRGYLSRPVVPPTPTLVDAGGMKVAATGDFEVAAMERAVSVDGVIAKSLDVWEQHALERRCTLFFCVSLAHAQLVRDAFVRRFPSLPAGYLDGTTDKRERAKLIEDARAGRYRVIFQVATMTTGTDIPLIDCIMWLRPTASAVLWVQGNGRGLRLAEGKNDCLVLDVVGNHDRFSSVLEPTVPDKPRAKKVEFSDEELLAMGIDPGVMKGKAATKECPKCKAVLHAAARKCDACGHLFISFDKLHTADSKPFEVEVLEAKIARASTASGEPCYVATYRTKEKVYREWILDQRPWAKPIAKQRLEQIRQGVTRIRLTPNPSKPLFPKIEVVAYGNRISSDLF